MRRTVAPRGARMQAESGGETERRQHGSGKIDEIGTKKIRGKKVAKQFCEGCRRQSTSFQRQLACRPRGPF